MRSLLMAQCTGRQPGPAFDRLDATRSVLGEDPRCTGQVGVIRYCMGGGFALLPAGRPDRSAASVSYGQVPDSVEDVLSGACPVVASFGGRDKELAGAAQKIRAGGPEGIPAPGGHYSLPRRRTAHFSSLSTGSISWHETFHS